MHQVRPQPGPYEVAKHFSDDRHDGYVIVDADGNGVFNLFFNAFDPPNWLATRLATAFLLAASHELLAVARHLISDAEMKHPDLRVPDPLLVRARAAVAGAETFALPGQLRVSDHRDVPTSSRDAATLSPLSVLQDFITAVESVDGVTRTEDGYLAPTVEPSWTAVGDSYVDACRVMHAAELRKTPDPMVDGVLTPAQWYEAPAPVSLS